MGAPVFVEIGGTLAQVFVKPGQHVVRGQELARLEDLDLELAVADLEGQRDTQLARLAGLSMQRTVEGAVASQLPELEKSLAALAEQIAEKQAEREQLTMRAPHDGVVWPPPATQPQRDIRRQPSGWAGTPFAQRNCRAFLPAGTLFCQVGPPDQMRAELIVDQTEIELIRLGQAVEMQLAATPHDRLLGRVAEISRRELAVAPQHLSNKSGGELASRTDSGGQERPASASYQVSVPIDHAAAAWRPGGSGQARIFAGYRTVFSRLYRWVRHTFHFRL